MIYASIESLKVVDLPLTIGIDAYVDVKLVGVPGFEDGVYRQVTRQFLRWLVARIELAERPGSGVPPEAIESRVAFLNECRRQSGLEPSEMAVRSDYKRPCDETAFEFVDSLCIWDATEPDRVEARSRRSGHSPHTQKPAKRPQLPESVIRCPFIFPMCRSMGREAEFPTAYFRSDSIPNEYTHYHIHNGVWHEIPIEWRLPPGVPGSSAGIWEMPKETSLVETS